MSLNGFEYSEFSGEYTITGLTDDRKKIIIPEGVTDIANGAFAESNIESVTLPSSLIQIGNEAFCGCERLREVIVPKDCKLKAIGEGAFAYSGIQSFGVTKGLHNLGAHIFENCASLEKITFEEGAWLLNIPASAFEGSGIKEIEIPDYVKVIEDSAFYECEALERVTFGENSALTEIETDAFAFCSSLFDIKLPMGLISLGNNAFYSCDKLSEITLPKGLKSVGMEVFKFCHSLKSIYFDGDTAGFDKGWSSSSAKLVKARSARTPSFKKQPQSTTPVVEKSGKIGENTVSSQNIAATDKHSSSVISAPTPTAKSRYTSFDKMDILRNDDGTVEILKCNDADITEVVFPPEVIAIGKQAFSFCKKLRRFISEGDKLYIKSEAFIYCEALEDVKIPRSAAVSNAAFRYTAIKSAYVGNTVNPFAYADTPLKSITFGSGSVTVYEHAFDCTDIEELVFEGSAYISSCAFMGCTKLRRIVFRGHTNLSQHAFHACTSLTEIVGLENVYSLPYACFSSCHSLKEVTFHTRMVSPCAYADCNSVEKITLYKTMVEIPDGAPVDSAALREIYAPGCSCEQLLKKNYKAFKRLKNNITVYCNDGAVVVKNLI